MKGDEMISFTIQLYDLDTGNHVYSRKQFLWPVLPRVDELVLLDVSSIDMHDEDFFEVSYVWHYIESEIYPHVCVVDFNLKHTDFVKFENRPEWIHDLREVEKPTP